MIVTGMLYAARRLAHVDFPAAEVLGPEASKDRIQSLIDRHNLIFIKPLFKGGVGKQGKSGLTGKATDLKTALAEKERLYFVEHRHGNAVAKANGVTFEGGGAGRARGLFRDHGGKSNHTDIYETFRAWEMPCASVSAGMVRRRSMSWSDAAGRTWCAAWARSRRLTTRSICPTGSSAGFGNVFLYGRMIGAAAEIDDHLNRGCNMDKRTPQEQCAFVV